MYSESLLNTNWDKTQNLKKCPWDKINGTQNAHFFLSRAPSHQFYFPFSILIWTETQASSL